LPLRKNFASERVAVAYSTSLEQFFHLYRVIKLRLIFMKVVANSCNSSRRQRFVREVCQKFVKNGISENISQKFLECSCQRVQPVTPAGIKRPRRRRL